MNKALVIGSRGTLGQALVEHMQSRYEVHEINRATTAFSDAELASTAHRLQADLMDDNPFALIICTVGFLTSATIQPEKKMSDLNTESLMEYFAVNTIIPTLCIKHFSPLLQRQGSSCFAVLSAMVGSIADNKLGGWYGYRSSKAALNMMVKTAAIELGRTRKQASLIAIHPGTTIGPLTKPFAKNIDAARYYEPHTSAQRIIAVCDSVTPNESGGFFNWDGQPLRW